MDATNNITVIKADSHLFPPLNISQEKDKDGIPQTITTRTANVAIPEILASSAPTPVTLDTHAKAVALLETLETLNKTNTCSLLTATHFKHLPVHLLVRFLVMETFLEIMTYIPHNTSKESLGAFQELKQFLDTPQSPLAFFMKLHTQFSVPKALFIPLIRRLRCLDDLSQLTDVYSLTKTELKSEASKATNVEIEEMFRSIFKLRSRITRTQSLITKLIRESFEELEKNYKKMHKDLTFIKNRGLLHTSHPKMRTLNFYLDFTNKYRPFLSFVNNRFSQNLARQSVLESQTPLKPFEVEKFIHETNFVLKLGSQILSAFDNTLTEAKNKDEESKVDDKAYRDKSNSLIANFYPTFFKQLIQHMESYTGEKKAIVEECSLKTLMEFMKRALLIKMKIKSPERVQQLNQLLFKEVYKLFPPQADHLLYFTFTTINENVDNLLKEIRIKPSKATLEPMNEHVIHKCLSGLLIVKVDAKLNKESLLSGLADIERLNTHSLQTIEENTDELFEEDDLLNDACFNLKTFQATLSLSCQGVLPLLSYCKGILTKDNYSEQDIDALWMHTIDTEVQQRPKVSLEKKRITPPKKPEQKKVEKNKHNKTKNTKQTQTETVIANPLTLFSFFKNFLCDASATFPSDVVDQNPAVGAKLYDLDQAYHIAHVNMALEMLTDSLHEERTTLLPLLVANFNYHLYMSQEQAITPLYLATNPHGELIHDVSSMARILGTKTLPDRYAKGSFWYRYPNQNKHNRTLHNVPTTLDLNLKYEQEMQPTELLQHLKTFRDVSKEGVKFFFDLTEDFCAEPADKAKFEKLHLELDASLDKLEKGTKPQATPVKLASESSEELDSQLLKLSIVIKSIEDKVSRFESNKGPENQMETLKDLLLHVKRIEKSISLLKHFPQQRHLSVHAHNFVFFGQYMVELAGAFESQIKGENFRDHDLTAYQELLNWDKWLKMDLQAFITDINVKKGSEYIHWEFFKCKGIVPKGLKLLSEAYRLSINASEVGEGFLPKEIREDLGVYQDKLVNLARSQVCFIEQYYNNVLANIIK